MKCGVDPKMALYDYCRKKSFNTWIQTYHPSRNNLTVPDQKYENLCPSRKIF